MLGLIAEEPEPLVMFHDYHLYTAPAVVRDARPDAFLHHFVHIPWSQPDSWRILPAQWREEIYRGLLANDIIGFHTTAYCRNFLTAAVSCSSSRSTTSAARSFTTAARPGCARTRSASTRAARAGRRIGGGGRATRRSSCAAAATT